MAVSLGSSCTHTSACPLNPEIPSVTGSSYLYLCSTGRRGSRRRRLTFFISLTTRGTMRRSLPSTSTGESPPFTLPRAFQIQIHLCTRACHLQRSTGLALGIPVATIANLHSCSILNHQRSISACVRACTGEPQVSFLRSGPLFRITGTLQVG